MHYGINPIIDLSTDFHAEDTIIYSYELRSIRVFLNAISTRP